MAAEAGKHIYCEKPLGHSVFEARAVQEKYIQNRDKLATQMGNQGTANSTLRKSAAVIKAGKIGQVKEVHVWTVNDAEDMHRLLDAGVDGIITDVPGELARSLESAG